MGGYLVQHGGRGALEGVARDVVDVIEIGSVEGVVRIGLHDRVVREVLLEHCTEKKKGGKTGERGLRQRRELNG